MTKPLATSPLPLTDAQQRFLKRLPRTGRRFSNSELVDATGLSAGQVRTHVHSLVRKGRVRVVSEGSRGVAGVYERAPQAAGSGGEGAAAG